MFDYGPLPFSEMPGVVFPALPPPRAAWAMALQVQLAQSEWWPRERLEAVQLQQAALLLEHARLHCPWYHELLPHAETSASSLTWQDWRQIPLLTRDTLRSQLTALSSTAPPKEHGKVGMISTSGSTGSPVLVPRTELNQMMWKAANLRDHLWHRRDLATTLVSIRYLSAASGAAEVNGVRLKERAGWGVATDEILATGRSIGVDICTDVARQWAFLREVRPEYLLTYPSNLRALVQEARRRGEQLPGLREARTVSEALPDDLREEVRQILGVRLVDAYSTKELGYVALQHPELDHYLVQAEFCIVEVLREDGNPCAPGEVGKVVLTDLHSFALPLIRYDVGDFAEVAPASPCGRGLPAIRRVLGRVRNMLVHADGRKVWPLFPDRRFSEIAPVRQYQIVQKSLDHIEARVVLEQPLTTEQGAALRDAIGTALGREFRIDVIEVEGIPRTAPGKFEDFRSEVAD
jgi:phenylacetate-CoA ligase